MGVPKRKRSRPRRDKRFANKGIQVKIVAACQNCKEALIPHAACKHCGYYKGAKVLVTKLDRTIKRGKVMEQKNIRKQTAAQPASAE